MSRIEALTKGEYIQQRSALQGSALITSVAACGVTTAGQQQCMVVSGTWKVRGNCHRHSTLAGSALEVDCEVGHTLACSLAPTAAQISLHTIPAQLAASRDVSCSLVW